MSIQINADFKSLEQLVSRPTFEGTEPKDYLQMKLLYLILEETAASRRQAQHTNKLLEEISDSLKKSTKAVERLAKATIIYNRDGDVCMRTHKTN